MEVKSYEHKPKNYTAERLRPDMVALRAPDAQGFIYIHIQFCGVLGKKFWLPVLYQMYEAKLNKTKKKKLFDAQNNESVVRVMKST